MRKMRISELYERFERENHLKQLASATAAYYAEFLGCFFEWLPPRIKWAGQLTRELFEEYALTIAAKTENRTSQNTYLRAVQRFMNYGAEIGACAPYRLKLPKASPPVKPTFTDEETRRIINSRSIAKADVMALLLIATGIRSATLARLRAGDVQAEENALLLRHLKNGRQALLPLPPYVVRRLTRYIKANNLPGESLLFPTRNGKQFTATGLNHVMQKYCRAKGFEHSGVHIFRHTYAKYMAKAGCPSITLARFLTHSTIQQSEHYVNLYGQELRDACDRYNPVATFAGR